MASRYQRAKRVKFLRGLAAALLLFTVFIGALSLAGHITAETLYNPSTAGR